MSARLLAALAALALPGCTTNAPEPAVRASDQQAFLDACEDWDEWEKSAPPFKIWGNSYYVGSCGITSILVTGEDGHILIDGGSQGGGALVEQSIHKLGFDVKDVRILLHSHEHSDHVGGLAYLQRKSGAKVIASRAARQALETGQTMPDDPQHGEFDSFEPVTVAGTVRSFEPVSLGLLTLLPLATPGHTPGALSWQWWSCEQTDCRAVVYADSLSPMSSDGYRFSDHPDYLTAYRAGLARLADTPCDILLTPHPSAGSMFDRLASESGLQDKASCARYAEAMGKRLDEELVVEAGSK